MGFKLKDFADLVGIDKELSTYGTPVFEKELGGTVMAEANNDGTIFIDKGLSDKQKKEAVKHEKVHLNQMKTGRLHYDNETVTWKKDTKSAPRVYKRQNGNLIAMDGSEKDKEGGNFEWEKEAYDA